MTHVLRIISACVCVWFSVLASIHEGGLSYIYLSLVIPYVFNTLIKSRDYTLHIEGWGSYMVAIGYLPGHDDWEIFTLKIICMKNFCGVKFSRFGLICEIFLTVEDRRVPWEFLEHLVYYQILGEPGIAGCSCRFDIYLGGVQLCAHLLRVVRHNNGSVTKVCN